jgi:NAD(P)H-dependent flavin oxidoreductase YrpB (nitropropane dioxygenase family)
MGGVGTTELAASVIQAGGFGMVPSPTPPAAGACGINYLVPFAPSPDEIAEAARGVRVVEFFYGDPRADLVTAVHGAGALAGWQVGSAAEAATAAEAGCDYIVAQGTEAGGHVRAKRSLDEVLQQVLGAVKIPVLAAGGIATGERVAELVRAGADGVRVGTRFIATPESGAHPDYVQKLIAASGGDTVITEWFGEGWEHAPHRVLRSCLAAAERSGWRATMPPTKGSFYGADHAHYAGLGVGAIARVEPAVDVVRDLVRLL